ncbi:hypothetical protein FH972_021024 [Carpinus fangiana]|uniref:Uncharacterized protein n=1 Tax=Carpinus fangiana TaxID=176857 RepID=A0A5N6KNQ2_9ROSI|nr:hypothetical protein FH972_021024 [Carpinus fangiana]
MAPNLRSESSDPSQTVSNYSMKKSLRNSENATTRRPLPLPPSTRVMRDSMIVRSTAAARAATSNQIQVQSGSLNDPMIPKEKPLPNFPSGVHQISPKAASTGKGRLAAGTMRKPFAAKRQDSPKFAATPIRRKSLKVPPHPIYQRPSTANAGSIRRGHSTFESHPPSSWKPLKQTVSNHPSTGIVVSETTDPIRPSTADATMSNQVTMHHGSERSKMDKRRKIQRTEPPTNQESDFQDYPNQFEIAKDADHDHLFGEESSKGLTAMLVGWSRGIKQKHLRQTSEDLKEIHLQPSDDLKAGPKGNHHWTNFRHALEKINTTEHNRRPLAISYPIDHGEVFLADRFEHRSLSSAQKLTEDENREDNFQEQVGAPKFNLDQQHRHERAASVENRMTEMNDFIHYKSSYQPAPKTSPHATATTGFLSKVSQNPRQNHQQILYKGSPLEFGCRGEYRADEEEDDPFTKVGTENEAICSISEPERRTEAEKTEDGLGIRMAGVDLSSTACPRCQSAHLHDDDGCFVCGWPSPDFRYPPDNDSPATLHEPKFVSAPVPDLVHSRMRIQSFHPTIAFASPPPSQTPTFFSDKSQLRLPADINCGRTPFSNADLSSSPGPAFLSPTYGRTSRSISPTASSVYSDRSSDMYADPRNPFTDQRAVDAYRAAMDRWHPPVSQLAPTPIGAFASSSQQHSQTHENGQHRHGMIEGAAVPFSRQHEISTPVPSPYPSRGHSTYTLSGFAGNSNLDMSYTDGERGSWMTLNSHYQPLTSSSRGMLEMPIHARNGTTVNPRSFAMRTSALQSRPENPLAKRSAMDKDWPYSS